MENSHGNWYVANQEQHHNTTECVKLSFKKNTGNGHITQQSVDNMTAIEICTTKKMLTFSFSTA